jgi:hypothetical protein
MLMSDQSNVVEKVRLAIQDRALYLALLYRSFSEALPAEQAEQLARQAIFAYGQARGKRDAAGMTPEKWVDSHVSKGSAAVFESRIVKEADHCEQQMTYCPLVQAWRELGCTPAEIDLLCDIAMEVDRGRAAYHGIPLDITHRIAAGDDHCCLVLKNPAG